MQSSPESDLFKDSIRTPGRVLQVAASAGLLVAALSVSLFLLFILHQATLWVSSDPSVAFDRARYALQVYRSAYDTTKVLWDSYADVGNTLIPLWNSLVHYTVQPTVFVILDVMSIVFANRPYEGILGESEVPYEGFKCPSAYDTNPRAAEWCGLVDGYAFKLGAVDGTDGGGFLANSTLVLPTAYARRLSFVIGEPLVPAMHLDSLVAGMRGAVSSVILILGTVSDVVAYVAHTLLSELLGIVVDLFVKLATALAVALMSAVRTGVLKDVLRLGIQFFVVLAVDILVPMLLFVVNSAMCLFDFARPAGWAPQLECVNELCLGSGLAVKDHLHVFTSVPAIARQVEAVVVKLLDPQSGETYEGTTVEVPEVDSGSKATPASAQCEQCFVCKVPELRVLWLLVVSVAGCILDANHVSGRVQSHCQANGSYYELLCGPRDALLGQDAWMASFTEHRRVDFDLAQEYAQRLATISTEEGGRYGDGFVAAQISRSWTHRDPGLGKDQSARFVRDMCVQMRLSSETDGGPDHNEFESGTLAELSRAFVYQQCKLSRAFETCVIPSLRDGIDFGFEVSSCMRDKPSCIKGRERCLGQCGTSPQAALTQDFATLFVKRETSADAVGNAALGRGRADCRPSNVTLSVDLFAPRGDTAFRAYSSRIRVRGGFTAVDPRSCAAAPQACAAVQRVLEREPTLLFDEVSGRFVHRSTLRPPPPPPPPLPPPRLFGFDVDSPPPPRPPPRSPPHYARYAEACIPVTTASESGVQLGKDEEERAVCLYVRALVNQRVSASRCFGLHPSPPPPPTKSQSRTAAEQHAVRDRRVRTGLGSSAEGEAPARTEEEEFSDKHGASERESAGLLDRLAAENFGLRPVLSKIKLRLGRGRRLFERLPGASSHDLALNKLEVPGLRSLPSVTMAECQALCSAMRNESSELDNCRAVLYSLVDPGAQTGARLVRCQPLRSLGSCSARDFAASVFRRRDSSGCTLPTAIDNPACVALSPVGTPPGELRVIDYESARSICGAGKGQPALPSPRSSLESFSMVSHAKEQGVTSFFARKVASGQDVVTHWPAADGSRLIVRANDPRCVLLEMDSTSAAAHFYASLQPCAHPMADGVVCESASAAPPAATAPPPLPPPPPVGVEHAMRAFARGTVLPRTQLLCSDALLDADVELACTEFVSTLARTSRAGLGGAFTPLCAPVCWHSCSSASGVDTDGFAACPSEDCADTPCSEFLLRECPPVAHAAISRLHSALCGGERLPAPPLPPLPPPLPPLPPDAPPPPVGVYLRSAVDERPYHPDCAPVTYSECLEAARQLAAVDARRSSRVGVSAGPCEGALVEGIGCFVGCSLGSTAGEDAIFHALLTDSFSTKQSRRCADNAVHPMCLCKAVSPPTERSAADSAFAADYVFAGLPNAVSDTAQHSAYFRPAAVDNVLMPEYVGPSHRIACPGADSGAPSCARLCAADLGAQLQAFQVHATASPPSPPVPDLPPAPPGPPPSPRPPLSIFRFHGATEGCANARVYSGSECRDGGVGSVWPPLCDYGSQNAACGPRADVGDGAVVGENSCVSSGNGVCEDGGAGSSFSLNAAGESVAVCGFAQDATDCPLRLAKYGPLTFSQAEHPPAPAPPLVAPAQPPPLFPPHTFVSCNNTCSYTAVCSDGGLGAYLVDNEFKCDYGTSCEKCGPRQNVLELRADSSQYAFNGVCDDISNGGAAGGYGTDYRDCGVRFVQHAAGAYARGRRAQAVVAPPPRSPPRLLPSPPPAPPPPSPHPPAALGQCECQCVGEVEALGRAAADEALSRVELQAMASRPLENAVLYQAHAALVRGATLQARGVVYSESLKRYVETPFRASRLAHVAAGRRVARPAASSAPLEVVSEPPLYFINACPQELAWAEGYSQAAHPCSSAEYKGKCLVEAALGTPSTVDHAFCSAFAGAGAPCASSDESDCQACRRCFSLGTDAHSTSLAHTFADDWRMLPNASADAAVWHERCASFCVRSAPRHLLALVQVDLERRNCSCFVEDSPEPPSDLRAAQLLAGSEPADSDVSVFLARPAAWEQLRLAALAGTVNFLPALELGVGFALPAAVSQGGLSLEACLELCAFHLGEGMRSVRRQPATGDCDCFAEEADAQAASFHPDASAAVFYSARLARLAQPAEREAAFVWRPDLSEWLSGRAMDEGAGIRAANATLTAQGCATSCSDGCIAAELLVSAWIDLERATETARSPEPPEAPPAPPPPFAPQPPAAPGAELLRSWHPLGGEPPLDVDGDGKFDLTCTVDACGSPVPIYSGSASAVYALAGELAAEGAFNTALCPYDCAPTTVSHALSPAEAASLAAGAGFCGLQFLGLEGLPVVDVPGGVQISPTTVQDGLSRTQCAALADSRALLGGQLGLWLKNASGTLGQCALYRASRNKQQHTLWRAFATHAQRVVDFPHFQPSTAHCARSPSDSAPCGTDSANCLYWAEFDADTYACRPQSDISNVLTPTVLMSIVKASGVHYPPPAPPPPAYPVVEPPPPPPMVCSASHIPTTSDGRTLVNHLKKPYSGQLAAFCWTWTLDTDRRPIWPPEHVHKREQVYKPSCSDGTESTLRVHLESFRMWNRDSANLGDEVWRPTGAPYPECDSAQPNECCYARHQFRTCATADQCSEEEVYTNRKTTQCAARCRAEYRHGDDQACLPAFDECDEAVHRPSTFSAAAYLDVICLCGAKLGTRRLAQVDVATGGHLNSSAQCREDALEFKTRFMPSSTSSGQSVCDYASAAVPDYATAEPECSSSEAHECCVTDRHSEHLSTVHLGSGLGVLDAGSAVGTDIFEAATSSSLVTADLNEDGFVDLLVGSSLFLGDGSGNFSGRTPLQLGSTVITRAHVVDFDQLGFPDLLFVDDARRAYVMRSRNHAEKTARKTVNGEYWIESNASHALIRVFVLDDFEFEHFTHRKPIWITEADAVASDCSPSYLISRTLLTVDTPLSYSCARNGVPNSRCSSFWIDVGHPNGCAGGLGQVGAITVQTTESPTKGETPTYFAPQRIGDVDDSGVVDVAAAHVYSPDERGLLKDAIDLCLLFRGKPLKCFMTRSPLLPAFDSGTAASVIYPAKTDACHDCLKFADIRQVNKNSKVRCDNQQFVLGTSAARELYCVTNNDHGLQDGSRVVIADFTGVTDPECAGSGTCDVEGVRTGGKAALATVALRVTVGNYRSFHVVLPFSFLGNVSGTGIVFQVVSEATTRVFGSVATDRNTDFGNAMVVLREHSPASIFWPVDGFSGDSVGSEKYGAAVDGAYSPSGVSSWSFPTFVIANTDSIEVYDQLWFTRTLAENRVRTAFQSSAQAVAFCNLDSSRKTPEVELITARAGYATIYPFFFGYGYSGRAGFAVDIGNRSQAREQPLATALACADLNNDGHEDVVVHRAARHAGSCAFRCHELGRFGFEAYSLGNSASDPSRGKCFCGPLLSLAVTPLPPPASPPTPRPSPLPPPPPLPLDPPPPFSPPVPSLNRVGLCTVFVAANVDPPPPAPPRATPAAAPPPPPRPHSPQPAEPPPPSPPAPPLPSPPPPLPSPPPPRPPSPPMPPGSPPPVPSFPPIESDDSSRLIFFDLATVTSDLIGLHDATGWQPSSVRIPESPQGFPDTTIVEGLWFQEARCQEGAKWDTAGASRAQVTLGQIADRPDCVHAAPGTTREMLYRNSRCTAGRAPAEESELSKPTEFVPGCMVVLVTAASRTGLFEELTLAGRDLADPLKIEVGYTKALSPNPDLDLTATQCAISMIVHDNYLKDTTGQEVLTKMSALGADIVRKDREIELFDQTMRALATYRPPAAPSTEALAPETPQQRIDKLRAERSSLSLELEALRSSRTSCVPSRDTVCGRTLTEAPDPWIAANGQRCAGFLGREALEGAFCGHWLSSDNVESAEASQAVEMMTSTPPWCYSESGEVLDCAATARRVVRSGVNELAEMARPDRSYCESRFFRDLVLQDATVTPAACRANLTEAASACKNELCESCSNACTYPAARAVASVLKCTVPRNRWAFVHCAHVTDAGQLATASHGADRSSGKIAVPERMQKHLYSICHNNEAGLLQRDSVSCRKTHRNSPAGHFANGFDEKGSPVARQGFMVPCRTHADCFSACPVHPLTGKHYVCQKQYRLYDVAKTSSSSIAFLNLSSGPSAAFDPLDADATGICVDFDSRLNQGCADETAATVMDSVTGCADRFVTTFLCGMSVSVSNGDPGTASLKGSFFYPRELVRGTQHSPEVTCSDPADCTAKCRYLSRRSTHGAGTPPACAVCDLHCPVSLLAVMSKVVDAVWADVLSVARLLGTCFGGHGLSGCVCQLSLTLQPAWRKVSTSAAVRCENGDAFEMLVSRIDDLIQRGVESTVNVVVDGVNAIVNSITGWFGVRDPIGRVCFPTSYDQDRCVGGTITKEQRDALSECESSERAGLEEMCYYARVKHICSDSGLLDEYQQLFAAGTTTLDETEAEFARVFGDSFTAIDPAAAELLRAVEQSQASQLDLAERRDICSSSSFHAAMSLEMAIVSCFFSSVEGFCDDDATENDEFSYVVDTTELQLPRVPWHLLVDGDVHPPPPPPVTLSAYQTLVDQDPAGFEIVRAKLERLYPTLASVATSSAGASVGPHVADHLVTPQQLTRAVLASHGMHADSLGARVVQSKHTGRWRFACAELFRFLDDPDMTAPVGAQHQFDRNLLLTATLEVFLSLEHEHRAGLPFSTAGVWDLMCGTDVAGYRVPVHAWQYETYDTRRVEVDSFAPIVAYGSLDTLQSALAAIGDECPANFASRDLAQAMFCGRLASSQLALDARERAKASPFATLRDRMCNPAEEYSIEEAVARPPAFSSSLFDTSRNSKLFLKDMVVPAAHRGEEDVSKTGLKSLRAWVYVTSSADPRVPAGMHRLLDIPVFSAAKCAQLPDAACSAGGKRINSGTLASFAAASDSHVTGRVALASKRCNRAVEEATGLTCERAPFAQVAGCSAEDLDLVERPEFYASVHWLRLLATPPPAPPPRPAKPPPPSLPPPAPLLPPPPPLELSTQSLKQTVLAFEEELCYTVYTLSSQTRCDRFAAQLSRRVFHKQSHPPALPPGGPRTSAPPSPKPPPSPSLPRAFALGPTRSALLRTIRFPSVGDDAALVADGYAVLAEDEEAVRVAANGTTARQLARCTAAQAAAPLACATPSASDECVDGERSCSDNAPLFANPTLDVELESPPRKRRARLWGVRFVLPRDPRLAALFFASPEPTGGHGARVEAFDTNGAPLPCVREVAAAVQREFTHICLGALATESEEFALSEASRVRVTLEGSYRALFLARVDLVEIDLDKEAAAPPHG